MLLVPKKQMIFAQGAAADAVFYIEKGKVRLTVVSKAGKEATIGIINEGNFFGEGALAGQMLRMGSAAAMTECELLRVEKKSHNRPRSLHRDHLPCLRQWLHPSLHLANGCQPAMDQHQRFALAIDLVINLDAIHRCEAEAHRFHLRPSSLGLPVHRPGSLSIMRRRAGR